ncbi:hypothetical protein DFH09DRAFT_1333396 [Mycena vulgaris]|nr:hypothetical protein DFH09DRAFT_1333396 [Mycena vulgaris]
MWRTPSPPPIAAHYPAPCSPASSPLTAFWFESPVPVDALTTPSMEPLTAAADVAHRLSTKPTPPPISTALDNASRSPRPTPPTALNVINIINATQLR